MSINKVILVGRLGSDPDGKTLDSKTTLVNLNVATKERFKDQLGQKQERTEWHSVVAFDKLAETCMKFLKKGRQVYIEGRLHTREFTDKNNVKQRRTEIVASEVVFLGSSDVSKD